MLEHLVDTLWQVELLPELILTPVSRLVCAPGAGVTAAPGRDDQGHHHCSPRRPLPRPHRHRHFAGTASGGSARPTCLAVQPPSSPSTTRVLLDLTVAHAWLPLVYSLQGEAMGTEMEDLSSLDLQGDFITRARTRLVLFLESVAVVTEVRLS